MSEINAKYWDERKEEISGLIGKLWEIPEPPLMEYKSCELLCQWFEQKGFQVERRFCGIPTAFRATFAQGEGGPGIGILAEYDGLAGLSNAAEARRNPLPGQAAGHACLHSHIGGGNSGAAAALKEFLIGEKLSGRIVVVGCPAEELLWGKIALLDKGGFDGLDIALTCHVDYQNASVARPTLACATGEFAFGGVSSHAGAARNRNALDAVELAVASIERMRGHQFPGVSVEHVIRHGGVAPNITPDRTSLWLFVRDKDYRTMRRTYEYVADIVKTSARIAGVEVVEGFISCTRGYLPNDTLGHLLLKHLSESGVPPYSESDLRALGELAKNATGTDKVVSNPEIIYLCEGVDPYTQDDGEVSWRIPLGRVNWEIPLQIPLHNWCTTALAGMPFSRKGALACSRAIYLAAAEVLLNPAIAEEAKKELDKRVNGEDLGPVYYAPVEDLTQNPAAFWDGT
ncbi:MAG: peptidase dimerization domain-containing protein, partial [Desulfovibrionaceae bacterium]|nr:peptidase dimerization domain-containing protein [Desulfovibrionaceae bacterium]